MTILRLAIILYGATWNLVETMKYSLYFFLGQRQPETGRLPSRPCTPDVGNSGFIKRRAQLLQYWKRQEIAVLRAKNENAAIWEKYLITSRLCTQVTRDTRAMAQVLITKSDLFSEQTCKNFCAPRGKTVRIGIHNRAEYSKFPQIHFKYSFISQCRQMYFYITKKKLFLSDKETNSRLKYLLSHVHRRMDNSEFACTFLSCASE